MTEADLLSDIDPVLRRRESNMSEATSPLWVYCAGPMRGIVEFNFPAFDAATAQLRALGYKVISPAEQDLGRGFDPTGLTGNEDLSSIGFDLREALIADLNHIAFGCDAICLLPGWENSSGAKVELALAAALGLQAGTLEQFTAREPLSLASSYLYVDEQMRAPIQWFEPIVPEHEYLHGQAVKDRLDHFLTSSEALGELRVRYPTGASPERDNEVRITSSTGGQKGKKLARFDLIPVGPLWDVAELYGHGTQKYEDRNWERGYNWSLSYAAMQRHANLFWSRENDDPETGLPHLAAVVFHALALMEYRTTHPEFDNRPGQ